MKSRLLLIMILPSALVLSGCLGGLMSMLCDDIPDSDHCFQAAAVQEGDSTDCSKIGGKDFQGSNPPKDKCYLLIAENTGDPSQCDKIEGGFMSYSKSECLEKTLQNHGPDDCTKAEDEAACRLAYHKNGKSCGDGFIFMKTKGVCEVRPPYDNDDIESAVEGDLNTIKDAATGKYMDLLTKAIEEETDPAKLEGLQKYKEFLEKSGETLETVTTTVDQLKEIKRIFLDAYDPSMNIDKMPVDKILEDGLFTRMKNKLLGEKEKTPMQQEISTAEDGLTVYEAMLKRQKEIDFLQQGRLKRLGEVVTDKAKEKATSALKESVEDIAKGVAGKAMVAVTVVDHALTKFQETAKKETFMDLARAYDRRRAALTQERPGATPEQIHQATVAQVQEDPYRDNTNNGFVKFANILENKDCQVQSSELCIDNRVWWTAMDKAYLHANKKK